MPILKPMPAKSKRVTKPENSEAKTTGHPVGPATIDNAIGRALQPLELLEWALRSRLDDEELETFCAPLLEATKALCELNTMVQTHGLAAVTR